MLKSLGGGKVGKSFFDRCNMLKLLIGSIAVVFVLQLGLRALSESVRLYRVLGLSRGDLTANWAWYQPFTYMFLHSPTNIIHLLFNVLVLWMTGRDLEKILGPRRFLFFYIVSGVFAGLVHVLFSNTYVIGASGAVYGLLVAYTVFWPNREILVFFIFPMKIKYFTPALILLQLLYSRMDSGSGVAHYAHLGGAMAGGVLIFLLKKTGLFERVNAFNRERRLKKHQRRIDVRIAQKERVDAILDKISTQGISSLSYGERRFLDRAGRNLDLPPEE